MQSIKHKWLVPFVYFEWKCEQLSELLKRWAFLNILGHVGRFGILVSFVLGAYYYVTEADQRRMEAENERKAKHCQAWQVINAARGRRFIAGARYEHTTYQIFMSGSAWPT